MGVGGGRISLTSGKDDGWDAMDGKERFHGDSTERERRWSQNHGRFLEDQGVMADRWGLQPHSSGVSVDVSLPCFQVRKVKEIEDEQWEGREGREVLGWVGGWWGGDRK